MYIRSSDNKKNISQGSILNTYSSSRLCFYQLTETALFSEVFSKPNHCYFILRFPTDIIIAEIFHIGFGAINVKLLLKTGSTLKLATDMPSILKCTVLVW